MTSEESHIALKGHGDDRPVARYIENLRPVVNHPHGIAADIDLGFSGLRDVDAVLVDHGHIQAEFFYERLNEIVFACVQEGGGGDRLYPLLRGLGLGLENPIYLICVEQKFIAHVAVFNRLQIPMPRRFSQRSQQQLSHTTVLANSIRSICFPFSGQS